MINKCYTPFIVLVARQTERVAFSSYADHNLKNLGIDQPIIYNRVLLNEGSAYNEHSGWYWQFDLFVFIFSNCFLN